LWNESWKNGDRHTQGVFGIKDIRPLGDERFVLARFLSVSLWATGEEQLFVEFYASMPCRSDGPGFAFLVIDNPDMSLKARRAVQRNLMRIKKIGFALVITSVSVAAW
jgi:hypothetical protein